MANFVRFVDNVGVSAFGNTDSTGFKTGSLLASASATLNDITFTKGDGTQFTITVDTGSGGGGGSVNTGSLMLTGSVSGNTLTFTKGDGSTFILIVDTGSASTGGIFTQTGSFYATTNDLQITGSLDVSNGITGSLLGTASTASYVETAQTASYVLNAVSSSYSDFALTASYAFSASVEIIKEISSSHANTADTASYIAAGNIAQPFVNITASGNISASGTITANEFNVGSGKIYGNEAYNNYLDFNNSSSLFKIKDETYIKFDGSAVPYNVTVNEGTNNIDFIIKGASNNPLFKTDSSTNQIGTHGIGTPEADFHIGGNLKTNSHITASGNVSSSITSTSSFGTYLGDGSQLTGIETSQTASYVETAQTASFVTGSNVYGPHGSNSVISSSYALTASHALNVSEGSIFTLTGSAYSTTNDVTVTGSFQTKGDLNITNATTQVQVGSTTKDLYLSSRTNGTASLFSALGKVSVNSVGGKVELGSSATTTELLGSNVYIGNNPLQTIRTSGSLDITGSITGVPGLINELTSSYALTASYAFSASVEIIKEISSSHANFADTASYALDNVLTASVSNNTITFTKGDGSTFPITVDTGSSPTGGDGIFGQIGSTSIYSTTSSLQISGSTLQSTPLSTATVATQSGTDKYAMVVSESVWHYNANVGVPTSNAWKSGLDGSYFNNFDHNTDISEVLRFIATLLSSSAPDASPNTKYWGSTSTSYSGQSTTSKSSLFDGILGTSYENARLSQHWTSSAYITYSNTASYREAQTYLLDKGFLQASDRGTFGNDTGTNPFHGSYASRIPSTILQSGQFSSLAFTLTANAAGSSTVYSNINYFGMGTLDGGAAKPYEVIILSSQSYSDNYSNQTPTTSSNNYYTASSVTYSISSFGTTGDGLSLGKISTGNPSIPDAYQDGDFNSVDGPFSGRYYTDKATDNTDISSSGYYQMQDLKAGLKTGSMSVFEYQNGSDSNISFYIPNPYQAGFVPAGALVDITNGAPTATISDVLTRTVFTATSRSLSGAPYMLDVDYTFTYNTQVSKSFDPGYAYSSTPIQVTNPTDQWENIGSTSTSNTSVSMNTSGINTNTANAGVFPAGGDPSSRRNTGIIPHVDDIAFLSSSLTFNLDSNANNITSATWNTSTNYDLTFRTTGRNWKNSSQTNTSATQELYDATLFNQPASSGSMAIYSYAQGYDGGTLQGTTEQFTGEDFRIEIDNDFLSGSYTNGNKFTTSTADYYNLSALDLQVRPGYLVRPGSSRGYWLTDPDPTKDYKYYARAFQTSDALTKTSLTINLGQTLENWDSTSDGVSVAIMFESAQTNIDTGGGALSRPVIYDPSTLSSLGISTNQANDDFMNPFTQNIDIKGNNQIGSGLVGTTYTVPLTDTLNQILNATYRNFIVLVRFKQAAAVQSITSITVSYS